MKALVNMIKLKPKKKRKYTCPPDRGKHICYKINGYWFWLNHSQWASFLCISRNSVSYRIRTGKSIAQALGFEKVVRAKQTGNSQTSIWRKKQHA